MSIAGTHDPRLVALSILIAMLSAYAPLELAGHIRATSGWASRAWLSTAAVALGGGIWAMHFIAMLAFSMPGMAVEYDLRLTVFSLILPILVTGLGFSIVHRPRSRPTAVIASGLFMGLGIAAMHYTGMAAMEMDASLTYDRWWAALSVLIAIAAVTVALWLARKNTGVGQRVSAAVVMGIAIAGMHYTAMVAASFSSGHAPHDGYDHASIGHTSLAVAIAGATFLILVLALIAAMFDRRFAVLAEKEAEALRRSEERFRSLCRRTPLPLHALDRDGRIEQVSDTWVELLGYAKPSLVARSLSS